MSTAKALMRIVFVVILCPWAASQTYTGNAEERVQTGRDIRVQPDEKVGDLVCIGCSVYVRGEVRGDVFAMGGRIVIEQGGAIRGDAATVAGSIQVENGASIGGDVAAIGGRVRRSPQGVIGGDVASMGVIWLVIVALVPLVVLGGVIALIVWLVQRMRQRAPVAAVS